MNACGMGGCVPNYESTLCRDQGSSSNNHQRDRNCYGHANLKHSQNAMRSYEGATKCSRRLEDTTSTLYTYEISYTNYYWLLFGLSRPGVSSMRSAPELRFLYLKNMFSAPVITPRASNLRRGLLLGWSTYRGQVEKIKSKNRSSATL